MMSGDDNDGQMIFGGIGGLKLPDICLTGEEKTSPRKLVPTGDRIRARCVTDANATTCPTAVDGREVKPLVPCRRFKAGKITSSRN